MISKNAPQFKGKSKEKRKEMAIAAYLSKESTIVSLSMIIKDPKTKKKLAANKVQWMVQTMKLMVLLKNKFL